MLDWTSPQLHQVVLIPVLTGIANMNEDLVERTKTSRDFWSGLGHRCRAHAVAYVTFTNGNGCVSMVMNWRGDVVYNVP